MALTVLVERVPTLLAGIALLAVAAWLLALDPRRRLHRAFALLLVTRAMVALLLVFTFAVDDYAGRLRAYFLIALPFTALAFGWAYRDAMAQGARAKARWVPLAIAACSAVVEIAYLLDHELFYSTARIGADAVFAPGILALAIPFKALAFASVALLFWRAARTTASPGQREALALAGLGLALEPAYEAANAIAVVLAGPFLGVVLVPPLPIFTALDLAWAAAAGVVGALVVGLARAGARRALVAVLLAASSGVLMVGVLVAEARGLTTVFLPLNYALGALWTLAAPLLVGYALAKHRLFGIERRARWTIKQSTVTGLFLGVFFVVSELAQQVFSAEVGPYLGIVAAGLLLFTLQPLQRAAERLAAMAIPARKPAAALSGLERAELYRDEVRFAAEEGAISPRAARLLEHLRVHLDLSPEEAAMLQRMALARPRPSPGARTAARGSDAG